MITAEVVKLGKGVKSKLKQKKGSLKTQLTTRTTRTTRTMQIKHIKINSIVLYKGFSCAVVSLADDVAVIRARGYASRFYSVPVTDLELHPLALAQGRDGDDTKGAFIW